MESLSSEGAGGRKNARWVSSAMRANMLLRLVAGALTSLLALVLVGLGSAWAIRSLVAETHQMHHAFVRAEQMKRFAEDIRGMKAALDTIEVSNFGYQPNFFQHASGRAGQSARELKQLVDPKNQTSGEAAHLRKQDGEALQLYAEFRRLEPELWTIHTRAMARDPSAVTAWRQTPGPAEQLQKLIGRTQSLTTELGQVADTGMEKMEATQALSQWGILLIGLLGLVLGGGLSLLMMRSTVKPIEVLTSDLERLAEGDLTLPAAPAGPRSGSTARQKQLIQVLSDKYRAGVGSLRNLIERIQQDAARISASTAEISAAAAQQASGSSQQATAITEVTVTVEQLNQTAVQIADAAASVAAAAEQALASAGRGQNSVRDSIVGMAMIRTRVNDIATRILALSEQSQHISEIIDVINNIAAQTHILALNAAVESAGAGEHGERFGVVAAEVKKLAQRSASATKEVREVIAQIQAATNAAVMATEDGLKETEKGVQLAHQSGDANEDIIQMVERTAQLASAISLATQQQRTASEQVVATMREVAQVTRQSATSSQQAAAAATELSAVALELRSVSQNFRLNGDHDDRHDGHAAAATGAATVGGGPG